MSAIIDGNVTTFIAALVLMWLGSGTVKGFAYTLIISLIVSMFTALVISRLLNLAFYAVGCRNEKLYGRAKEHKTIDFMKHRWVCFILSLVVIVAGFVGMIGYGAAGKGALNFSLEFKGGTSISADFGKDYTVEQVEDKIVPEVAKVINDNAIQASTVSGSNVVTIKTKTLSLSEREEVNRSDRSNNFHVALYLVPFQGHPFRRKCDYCTGTRCTCYADRLCIDPYFCR